MKIQCECGNIISLGKEDSNIKCKCGLSHEWDSENGWEYYTKSEIVEVKKIKPMTTSESYCLFDKINEIINYINERDAE